MSWQILHCSNTQDYQDEATNTKTHVFSTKTQVSIQVQFVSQTIVEKFELLMQWIWLEKIYAVSHCEFYGVVGT